MSKAKQALFDKACFASDLVDTLDGLWNRLETYIMQSYELILNAQIGKIPNVIGGVEVTG